MAKHTPGPWRARRHNDNPRYRWANVLGGDGRIVATFTSAPAKLRGDAEVTANARLIAAAPDLLDAIRRWLNYDDIDLLDACEFGLNEDETCKGDPPHEPICPACQLRAAIKKAEEG